jgi:hypothetical protein
MTTNSTRQPGLCPAICSATQRDWARARALPRVPILISVAKSDPQWQVLQDPEEQLPQEAPLGLEVEVNLYPTLAAQVLINLSTLVWPQ